MQLLDKLMGAIIGLARAAEGNEDRLTPETDQVIALSLLTTPGTDSETLTELLRCIDAEKKRLVPDCYTCAAPCGRTADYDMAGLWHSPADIRCLKCLILASIRNLASYAALFKYQYTELNQYFYKALSIIGIDGWGASYLQSIAAEAVELEIKCRQKLSGDNA